MKKAAVIYVKEGGREAAQEFFCRVHAFDNDYEVLYVTKNLDDVNLCDVLLVTNHSVISRNEIEYYGIVNDLKENGIELEVVITEESAGRYIDILTREFKKDRVG